MGKNNRARRAAKAKQRNKVSANNPNAAPAGDRLRLLPHRSPLSSRSPGPNVGPRVVADAGPRGDDQVAASTLTAAQLDRALEAAAVGTAGGHADAAALLLVLEHQDIDAVGERVWALMQRTVDRAWLLGWQPSEVTRHVRRGCSPAAVQLLRVVIAVDHAGRSARSIDPRWARQIDELELADVGDATGAQRLQGWAAGERLDRAHERMVELQLAGRLLTLPVLDELISPPGGSRRAAPSQQARSTGSARSVTTDPVLHKVRALLAQAESTSFEAEAETFTAKAQELMARHAIDHALLYHERELREEPLAIRIPVDDPYVEAKSHLLQTVAEAGRCRAVFHTSLGLSTIIGFATDLGGVQLVYTSLLVQAQTALRRAAAHAPPGSRVRSRAFRSAFLLSYSTRIRQRLDQINDAVVAQTQVGLGPSLLPALRSRAEAVDDVLAARFGSTVIHRLKGGFDAAGWASGRVAADCAQIGDGVIGRGDVTG